MTQPVFFYGVVENNVDPEKLGRIQVRFHGLHTDQKVQDDTTGIPTSDLPWAICAPSITEAGVSGLGRSPTGIVQGAWVMGVFRDKDHQSPVVFAVLPGRPASSGNSSAGFSDPAGVYPLADRLGESDVNRLARNEKIDQTIVQHKKETLIKDVPIAKGPDGQYSTWSEPDVPYATVYPFNKVTESESGHITEIDDTPDHERIHEYHKSGTFREVHPDGSVVTKVVKDNYTIVYGDDNVLVTGNVNLTVNGACNLLCLDDINIQSKSKVNISADKEIVFSAPVIKSSAAEKYTVVSPIGELKFDTSLKMTSPMMDILAAQALKLNGDTLDIKSNTQLKMSCATGNINATGKLDVVGFPATINAAPPLPATPAAPATQAPDSWQAVASSVGSYQTAVTRDVLVQEAGDTAPNDDVAVATAPVRPIKPITTAIAACGLTVTTPIDYEMVLAGPFKLKHFCHTTLWYHNIPEGGQNGLSAQAIICNLKALCENILIPLIAQFPGMRINSGFRAGTSGSQHNKGMAVDLSWPNQPGDANTHAQNIYNWMVASKLPFDQVISERKSSMWIHVSFNGQSTTQRTSVISTPNGSGPYSSGFKVYSNANTWGSFPALPASKSGPEPLF
jgi:hypothetical protein